ncbi:MAG: hypothetical protein J7L45_00975 [Candidatus Aenigmarchaeota archaeon]|nr:hypothetical protein [Candidatus Aenigmarchaeota archaeon]
MRMKPEEYLKKFEKAKMLKIDAIDFYDRFEDEIWKRYFIPAEEVVIELRYEKEEPPMNKKWSYSAAGIDGDDRIFLKLEDEFKRFPYPLSGDNSGSRALGIELFSRNGARISKIDDKLLFILHDLSEKEIIGTVEGYDPEKILSIEQEKFGHAVITDWKLNIPWSILDKFKWSLDE